MEASAIVLAGVIPGRTDRLEKAFTLLTSRYRRPKDGFEPSPFEGNENRLWLHLLEYREAYRAVMPTEYLVDVLRTNKEGLPAEVIVALADAWKLFRDTEVTDDKFLWAVTSLHEAWRIKKAGECLMMSAAILRSPQALGERTFFGYSNMRDYLTQEWAKVDALGTAVSVPEMDLALSYNDAMDDVGSAVNTAATRRRFSTSIPQLDAATAGGPASGQLWFVAAYAGEGKTMFALNVLAYQAVLQGLNVLYFTGETLIDDIRRRMLVRHTRDPSFGLPAGLDAMKVQMGGFTDQEAQIYQAAAADLTTRSGEDYGRLIVRQMPIRNHFADIESTLERLEAQFPVDVLVVDSIDMVRTPRPNWSYREQLSESIEQFAGLSVAYAGGRGLTVISPYQIKRAGYENALANSGRYDLSDLSETAMAERRAHLVLSLLRLPDSPSQLRCQLLKNRGGPTAEFQLTIDYRSGYIGTASGVASMSSAASLLG